MGHEVRCLPGLWSGFQPTVEPTGFQPVVVQFIKTVFAYNRISVSPPDLRFCGNTIRRFIVMTQFRNCGTQELRKPGESYFRQSVSGAALLPRAISVGLGVTNEGQARKCGFLDFRIRVFTTNCVLGGIRRMGRLQAVVRLQPLGEPPQPYD
jgi:hypothetical protein